MNKFILGLMADSTTIAGLIAALVILLTGCSTRQSITEGTSTAIGLYIPMEGSIYGAEIVSYLSGMKISTTSNHTMHVEREFASTNSYFGIITTTEHSKTKADV